MKKQSDPKLWQRVGFLCNAKMIFIAPRKNILCKYYHNPNVSLQPKQMV